MLSRKVYNDQIIELKRLGTWFYFLLKFLNQLYRWRIIVSNIKLSQLSLTTSRVNRWLTNVVFFQKTLLNSPSRARMLIRNVANTKTQMKRPRKRRYFYTTCLNNPCSLVRLRDCQVNKFIFLWCELCWLFIAPNLSRLPSRFACSIPGTVYDHLTANY